MKIPHFTALPLLLLANLGHAQQHHNIDPVPMHHDMHDAVTEHPEFPIELSFAGVWESH